MIHWWLCAVLQMKCCFCAKHAIFGIMAEMFYLCFIRSYYISHMSLQNLVLLGCFSFKEIFHIVVVTWLQLHVVTITCFSQKCSFSSVLVGCPTPGNLIVTHMFSSS